MGTQQMSIYTTWAPDGVLWTPWVKPVLFTQKKGAGGKPLEVPEIPWLTRMERDAAVIVDIRGEAGVLEGLALAKLGYRPIPLYNGVSGPRKSKPVVHVEGIVDALFRGAAVLASQNLPADAPPAFLLDSNRMRGAGKQPGTFDNRWCVFPQDMPSASFLKSQGTAQVILRSQYIRSDLSHILCRYQEQGIPIYQSTDGGPPVRITAARPPRYRSLFYRLRMILGLTRNASGSFGAAIPEPLENSSDGYYYGAG